MPGKITAPLANCFKRTSTAPPHPQQRDAPSTALASTLLSLVCQAHRLWRPQQFPPVETTPGTFACEPSEHPTPLQETLNILARLLASSHKKELLVPAVLNGSKPMNFPKTAADH